MPLILFGCCSKKKTLAQLEVERAKQEINILVSVEKLSFYKNILRKVKDESEVDMITISLKKNAYIFAKDDVMFSGYYDLKQDIITQRHYKEHIFTEADKRNVKKWLEFVESFQIYGFDKNIDKGIRIYVKPNIYLLFFEENTDQSYLDDILAKGEDIRGDFFRRLTDDVIVATVRR